MLDLTGYKLTFDEEFNSFSVSQSGVGTTWADIRSEWRYDANSDIGFGHSSFVDAASGYNPFSVANGALTITAVPDRTPYGYPGSWESGLITTQHSFSQTYGYFEIRADFSALTGAWDAFWLLPVTSIADPNDAGHWQELDVVEHYGANDKGVYSTIHTTDAAPNQHWQQYLQVYSELTSSPGYHTYGMDWEADKISFYVDGHLVGSQATPSDMHGPMYLLANLATQADADNAGVPISSSIDYIRAYSSAADAVAVTQGTVSAPDGNDPGTFGATVAQATTSSAATSVHNASATSQLAVTASTNTAAATSGGAHTPTDQSTDGAASTISTVTTATSSQLVAGAANTVSETSSATSVAVIATANSGTSIDDHLNEVFRFYDTHTGDHFFTTSAPEAAHIKSSIPYFNYEGVSWATPDKGAGTEDVFRFLDTATGTHFYTAVTGERDQIIASNGPYHYEGMAFEAYTADTHGTGMVTLERFYNTTTGLHFYAYGAEADGINHGAAGAGWVDEGPAFTVRSSDGSLLS